MYESVSLNKYKICNLSFDVLFFMQDSFILEFVPKLIQMLKAEGKDFVSLCYFPVDATIKPEWLNNVMVVDVPITYTKFAFNECIKVNPSIKDKLQIIPHGVDLNTFFPVKKERVNKFREAFFSFQADKFIYMNLNRNQQRKDIPRTIMAFKEVRKADPDTILYLHCAVKDVGHELDKVVQSFGFTLSDVVFPQNFGPNQGFPIETVNMIYNAVDVVVSTTLGEGFGFSWIEGMATKTPVIMPDNTAMAEYITDDIGYLVRSGSNPSLFTVLPYDNEMIRPLVDVEHLAETMLHVKNNYDEALEKAENAYKFVKENLTWQNHIVPMWINVLEKALTSDFNKKDVDKKPDKLILAEDF